jgi:glycosyltransferase involved in cell wall biosynthesis
MQVVNRLQKLINTYSTKLGSWRWSDHSRIFIVTDDSGWSLDWDACELKEIFRRLGVLALAQVDPRRFRRQCVFRTSRYFLMNDAWLKEEHRVAFPYYHGIPGTGFKEFDLAWDNLTKHHESISRIQVTNTAMHRLILATGIDPAKVFLIPIGINLNYFPMRTLQSRHEARKRMGIEQTAFVVGSFQKDGNGWDGGNEPKLIKGPDVFVEAMRILKQTVPELIVLLSGPARGYVKQGLRNNNIPFIHHYVDHYPDVANLYNALDVYVVSSRQEGGPKAVLEAMATGVPLVTTQVGQAVDLVMHGENGWLVDAEDFQAIAACAGRIHADRDITEQVITNARQTAESNRYEAQHPLWQKFTTGFVEPHSN